MNDNERLALLHKIFPYFKATPGALLNAKVFQDENQYVVAYTTSEGVRRIVVDFISKLWYVWPMQQVYPHQHELTQEESGKFWQELFDMLTSQPLVVNNINQNTKPITLTPFKEADWWAWGSAKEPIDSQPLINYNVQVQGFPEGLDIATLIVDNDGVEVYMCSQERFGETECWYEIEAAWPTGKNIVANMSEPITPNMLKQFGFIKVT